MGTPSCSPRNNLAKPSFLPINQSDCKVAIQEIDMWDIFSILASCAFFAIAIAYVRGCDDL